MRQVTQILVYDVLIFFYTLQPCVHATGPDGRYTTGVFRTVDTHGTGLKP